MFDPKKHTDFEIVVRTLAGLEEVLVEEIKNIGGKNIQIQKRAVRFLGNTPLLYQANYLLRSAIRVYVPIACFSIKSADDLYKKAVQLSWEKYITPDHTFAFDNTIFSSLVEHSHFASLKVKDALVDRMRNKTGKRPSVERDCPDIMFHIHLKDTECTISLDSSGSSLNKRGYRESGYKAPLNEVLAAGLIALSGWDKKTSFVDPMCGSGTLLIEAAMAGLHIPAGYFRVGFCFQYWPYFQEDTWKRVKQQADQAILKKGPTITGFDKAIAAVQITEKNIPPLLKSHIQVSMLDFFRSRARTDPGIILLNPPYGERIHQDALIDFYKKIGDQLKQFYHGFKAGIISSDKEAIKHVGLKTSRRFHVFNGPLESKFHLFNLY